MYTVATVLSTPLLSYVKSALCSRQSWQGSFLPWSLACMFSCCQLIACPSLASWTLCAFKLSVWKLFVPVLKNNACFLEIPCKRAKHVVFLFIKVEPFVLFFSFLDSWNFRVSLIGAAAGVVGVVLLSRELKHAHFWDADGNRKCAIFTFNLPSHHCIHIVKYLFAIRNE